MVDNHQADGGGANRVAPGHEVSGVRKALPALADRVFSERRSFCHAGGSDHRGEQTQRARLVCALATFPGASAPAKSSGGEAAPWAATRRARPGSGATAGRDGAGPAGTRLRGDQLDGAAVGRAPGQPLRPAPSTRTPYAAVCTRRACAGSARASSSPSLPRTSLRKKGARACHEKAAGRRTLAGA